MLSLPKKRRKPKRLKGSRQNQKKFGYMKQEDKDHLLNDRGLTPEQQDEVRGLFARLDLMGVEYYPLSFPLREIMDEKTFEEVYRTSPTAPNFLKLARQDVKNLLDTRIEFDIYIPSKGWVLNVNPSVFSGKGMASCIPMRNIGDSLNVFKNDDPLIDSFNSYGPIYFEKHHSKGYRYPCIVNDKGESVILLLWSKLQSKDYDKDNETPRKNDVPILCGWSYFLGELDHERFEEMKKKHLQKFLDNNPIWKEQYARVAAGVLLQQKTQSNYSEAYKKAKKFLQAGNPFVDFDDIID
jgi:hypothetical protein